jgi:hypothetical protein
MNFKTRDLNPDTDTNFILKSWLTTFKNTGPAVIRMLDSEYFQDYQVIIKHFMSHSKTTIVCDPDDEAVIWAYMVESPHAIHYIYVKETFRQLGIGKFLVSQSKHQHFTHWTHALKPIINKFPDLIYNPFKP